MRRAIHLAVLIVATLIAVVSVLIALQGWRVDPTPPGGSGAATTPPPVATRTAPRPIGIPARVVIRSLGVDEQLSGLGLEPDGAMTMPDFGSAGWYAEGPRPGDPGPAVVVAHVRGPAGPDVFWDLATLQAGDRVVVRGSLGRAVFVVESIETVDKDALPYDRIWPETDEPLLRLITCGGTPGPAGFPANTVVYARLL